MLSEFDLIAKYFTRTPRRSEQLPLGVGDDCALLAPALGMQLAVSTDMLVEGRHFFPNADPVALGHKCLAVNLSDLAAMGAKPLAFTLAFSLPEANAAWLEGFAQGMFALADQHQCELIGGDTTKGPLNICITIFGEVPLAHALRRDRAQVGDDIWVSGNLGDARLALAGYRNEITLSDSDLQSAGERMHQPTPRIALGLALRGIAHAAIDISDGLRGDLQHILDLSQVGATLDVDALPVGCMLQKQPQEMCRRFCLTGGDDYELCFTAPAAQRNAIMHAAQESGTPATRIGKIDAEAGLRLRDANDQPIALDAKSFDHFSTP